jgi:hypothetical protein
MPAEQGEAEPMLICGVIQGVHFGCLGTSRLASPIMPATALFISGLVLAQSSL